MDKRVIKIILTFLLSSALFFALLFCGYLLIFGNVRTVTVLGHEVHVRDEKVVLDGSEITDLASLQDAVRPLHDLKVLDLGSYPLEVADLQTWRDAFPGVELVCSPVVTVAGQTYPADTVVLDLSDSAVDEDELSVKVPLFTELNTLSLGENTLTADTRDALLTSCPNLSIEADVIYDLYGLTVHENETALDLTGCEIDDSLADRLIRLPQLTSVDLHGQPLTDSEKAALLEKLPDVAFGWTVFVEGQEADSAQEELDLSKHHISDPDELRRSVSLLCGLKKLVLCDCGLTNEQLDALNKSLPDVKVVWRVYMGEKWSLRTDAVAFSVLIHEHDYTSMTSEDIQVLKYCTDLQALDLGHQAITDISVIGEYLTELRLLILADNRISDITPLANLKHLHYLEIFVNRVTDLSPLASCRELVDLNVSYTRFSDVTPLLDLPMIERLWAEHTNASAADLRSLVAAYPNATVVIEGEGSVDQGWRTHKRYAAMRDMWRNDYLSEEFSKYDR